MREMLCSEYDHMYIEETGRALEAHIRMDRNYYAIMYPLGLGCGCG